jgi:hypothetical protein
MTTVYKTTVNYPNNKPGESDLTELWSRLRAVNIGYISGPETQDLGPGTGGFTSIRYWDSMLAAQTYIDYINELMTSYEKTAIITEEVT